MKNNAHPIQRFALAPLWVLIGAISLLVFGLVLLLQGPVTQRMAVLVPTPSRTLEPSSTSRLGFTRTTTPYNSATIIPTLNIFTQAAQTLSTRWAAYQMTATWYTPTRTPTPSNTPLPSGTPTLTPAPTFTFTSTNTVSAAQLATPSAMAHLQIAWVDGKTSKIMAWKNGKTIAVANTEPDDKMMDFDMEMETAPVMILPKMA